MSKDDVHVVVSDLRSDANAWDLISEAMNGALKIINDDCALPYATFDGLSALGGADKLYASAQDQITALLGGGVSETAAIASRLRATADNMTAADNEAADIQGR